MKVLISYVLLSVLLFVLGMIFDIAGLYVAVRCADKKNIVLSKFFYFIMSLGEVFTKVSVKALTLLPVIIIAVVITKSN